MASTRRSFLQLLGMLPAGAVISRALEASFSWETDAPGEFPEAPTEAVRWSFPENLEIFSIQGQSVFGVYGASGGLCYFTVFYLIDQARSLVLPVRGDFRHEIPEWALRKAAEAFHEKAHYVNMDGGDLGLSEGLDLRGVNG